MSRAHPGAPRKPPFCYEDGVNGETHELQACRCSSTEKAGGKSRKTPTSKYIQVPPTKQDHQQKLAGNTTDQPMISSSPRCHARMLRPFRHRGGLVKRPRLTRAQRTGAKDSASTFAVMLSPYRGAPDTGSVSFKRFSNLAIFLDRSSSSRTCFRSTEKPNIYVYQYVDNPAMRATAFEGPMQMISEGWGSEGGRKVVNLSPDGRKARARVIEWALLCSSS